MFDKNLTVCSQLLLQTTHFYFYLWSLKFFAYRQIRVIQALEDGLSPNTVNTSNRGPRALQSFISCWGCDVSQWHRSVIFLKLFSIFRWLVRLKILHNFFSPHFRLSRIWCRNNNSSVSPPIKWNFSEETLSLWLIRR